MILPISKAKNPNMLANISKLVRLPNKVSALALGMTLGLGVCTAQADDEKQYFDISENAVGEALKTFAVQTDSEILFTADIVKGKKTQGLQGDYTNQEALQKLLVGTGLSVEKNDEKVYLIHAANQQGNTVNLQSEAKGGVEVQDSVEKKILANRRIEEVFVTANKRVQDLQEVAFGLSAFGSDTLKRIGAVGAGDYLAEMPGVNYNSFGRGRSSVTVRGIGTKSNTINNLQSTTALYVDDLPSLSRWQQWTNTDPNLYDVERVEVLRGPQGTLFGSGALGGALRIITNKPDTSEFEANVEFGTAFIDDGGDSNNINGMVNIPILEDKLALRVVGYTRNDGGYIDNTTRDEKDVNSGETEGGRAILAYQATEDLNFRFTLTHQKDILDDGPDSFRDLADGGHYDYNHPIPRSSDVSLTVYNLVGEYDFGSTLLTSSTSYAERDSIITVGLTPLWASRFGGGVDPDETEDLLENDIKSLAQEVRLSSQGDASLEWTLGAFYFEQDIDVAQRLSADTLPTVILDATYFADITEKAIFGEATYHLTDKVGITVGGRWFDNAFEFEVPLFEGLLVGGSSPTPLVKQNDSAFTPKVSISYHPAEDVHLYATATQGYRVGQVNFGATPTNGIPLSFDHDSLWNYELGIKSTWLDNRLRLNAAAFYIDWSDIQLQRRGILVNGVLVPNFTDNAGNASSKGVELELAYLPADGWELGLSFTYTDAELDSVLSGVPLTPGARLAGTPDFSAANYVQYTLDDLPNNMSGYLRLSHRYSGDTVSLVGRETDDFLSDAYHLLNLRAGLYVDNYEVALYVNNLTNDDAATSVFLDAVNVPGTARVVRLQPRTMGVTFRVDF